MLGALRKMFIPKPPEAVAATYIALVAAARNPFFYSTLKVPDTLDGRFELIVLHLFLLESRLVFIEGGIAPYATLTPSASGSPGGLRRPDSAAGHSFAQFLSEAFFDDMDASLRELGVADTGVSKRIKKMGRSYHGSLQAYAAALNDRKALCGALARNVYGTVVEGDVAVLEQLATYVERMHAQLAATDAAVIMAGDYRWPDVAKILGNR